MARAAKRGMVDKVKDVITGLFTSSKAHPQPAETKRTVTKTATKAVTATKKAAKKAVAKSKSGARKAVKEVKGITKKVTTVSRKAVAKKKR